MPGFSGFKAVASICTAHYQLRCSLSFYFPFHASSSPLNLSLGVLFCFCQGTLSNLKSLLWLYLYSCPFPSHFLDLVSLYLPTNFPATNILVLKYGSFLSNSFCFKIQLSYLSCDHGVDFLTLIQGLDLARQCFVASLFLLVGHMNHGPTEWRHEDWGPLITLNSERSGHLITTTTCRKDIYTSWPWALRKNQDLPWCFRSNFVKRG